MRPTRSRKRSTKAACDSPSRSSFIPPKAGVLRVLRGGRRGGFTLIEVLIALGIFLIGSVSIVGLFVTAAALHSDAVNRRTASFIARSKIAEVKATPFRRVFARTEISADNGATIEVDAVTADPVYPSAAFDRYPVPEDQSIDRSQGAILLEGENASDPPVWDEWAYYTGLTVNPTAPDTFDTSGERDKWGTSSDDPHPAGSRVLQPRTWYYVLSEAAISSDTVHVRGDPTTPPVAPSSGYLVIDEEWMRYGDIASSDDTHGSFTLADEDNDGNPDRGLGDTDVEAHDPGTPVTVAREHPRYPGFYYTVQFYPAGATGAEAKVIISVAWGSERKLRQAFFFHTLYTPTKY